PQETAQDLPLPAGELGQLSVVARGGETGDLVDEAGRPYFGADAAQAELEFGDPAGGRRRGGVGAAQDGEGDPGRPFRARSGEKTHLSPAAVGPSHAHRAAERDPEVRPLRLPGVVRNVVSRNVVGRNV